MSGEELWLRDVIDMAYSFEGTVGTRATREVERAHPGECTEDVGINWQGICTRVDQIRGAKGKQVSGSGTSWCPPGCGDAAALPDSTIM